MPCCWVLMILKVSSFESRIESYCGMNSSWRSLAHVMGILAALVSTKTVAPSLAASVGMLLNWSSHWCMKVYISRSAAVVRMSVYIEVTLVVNMRVQGGDVGKDMVN